MVTFLEWQYYVYDHLKTASVLFWFFYSVVVVDSAFYIFCPVPDVIASYFHSIYSFDSLSVSLAPHMFRIHVSAVLLKQEKNKPKVHFYFCFYFSTNKMCPALLYSCIHAYIHIYIYILKT